MRKNTSFEKVGEPARNFVVVVSSTTERPVTGLELKHFTVYLRDPDGVAAYQRTPSGGVVRDTVPVTMTELGSTGVYRVSFVPTSRGTWKLTLIHGTHFTYGKRATYRVFDALYYVANESPLVEPFVVTDAAGNLQTGVPVSEFAALLYNPNLDEVSASVPVTSSPVR